MDYEQIIGVIGRAAGGLSTAEAEHAARATLQTLAASLPRTTAEDILRDLPAGLQPHGRSGGSGAPGTAGFLSAAPDIDVFLAIVAGREDTDVETALRHARAVFFALGDALSPAAIASLAASLPSAFDPLVAEAQRRYLDIMPADQYYGRVAQRLGVDNGTARLVTDAVLETLAERIAAGQVADLIADLDPVLHVPLRRGMPATPPAKRMPLEEFLRRVATKEGIAESEAGLYEEIARHARAVFATLAEAVNDQDWLSVMVELPDEYRAIVPARAG
jgi:uncharacterized protein (DUF2267 family)